MDTKLYLTIGAISGVRAAGSRAGMPAGSLPSSCRRLIAWGGRDRLYLPSDAERFHNDMLAAGRHLS